MRRLSPLRPTVGVKGQGRRVLAFFCLFVFFETSPETREQAGLHVGRNDPDPVPPHAHVRAFVPPRSTFGNEEQRLG